MRPLTLTLVAGLLMSCSSSSPEPPNQPPPQPKTEPAKPEQAAQRADLETLCTRVASRKISAWSQPVYASDLVRKLTQAVDAGTPQARCELGLLMQELEVVVCDDISNGLVNLCGD